MNDSQGWDKMGVKTGYNKPDKMKGIIDAYNDTTWMGKI